MSGPRRGKRNGGQQWKLGRALLLGALLLAPLAATGAPAQKKGSALVPMTVSGVRAHEGSFVVLLANAGIKRVLPIWVGAAEAQAIQLRLQDIKAPRPLTHDLLDTTLAVLRTKIARVEVDELRDGVYFGKLTLQDAAGKRYRIDGRPSDLIALAVGAKVPILVAPEVLEQAGLDPSAPPPSAQPDPEPERAPARRRSETL